MNTFQRKKLHTLLSAAVFCMCALLATPSLQAAPLRADTLYNEAVQHVQEELTALRSVNLLYGHIAAIKSRVESLHSTIAETLAAAAADVRDAADALAAEEEAIYEAGLEASKAYDEKYHEAMQEMPPNYEAIAAARQELQARRAELDARTATAKLRYEAAVEDVAEVLNGVSADMSVRIASLREDGAQAEEIRKMLAEYENEWAAASAAQRESEAGRALLAAAEAARGGIDVWTDGTDYGALARALASALEAFIKYVTAIDAVNVADAAAGDVYDLSGRLLLRGVTVETAERSLPAGIYVVNGRKVYLR